MTEPSSDHAMSSQSCSKPFRKSYSYTAFSIAWMSVVKRNNNVDQAMDAIQSFHKQYKDQKICITEFGPYNDGDSGCHFDQVGAVDYAKSFIPKINALDYVEKIFRNCGDAEPASECRPSLTNEDGSANDVLKGLGGACGFSDA